MLAIARTTTPSTVLSRIPVSRDGRCQLPLPSRPKKGLSILLPYVIASLTRMYLLVGAKFRVQ